MAHLARPLSESPMARLSQLGGALFVRAMYGYNGAESASLSFEKGDIIEVITQLESGWWDGIIVSSRQRGWFPSNYVTKATEHEVIWANEQVEVEETARLPTKLAMTQEAVTSPRFTGDPGLGALLGTYGLNGLTQGLSDAGDERVTSFSTGGNIFAEIAGAAAIAASSGSPGAYVAEVDDLPVSISQRPSQVDSAQDSSSAIDFWMPQVMADGHIIYYNSQTGETSRDMPVATPGMASPLELDGPEPNGDQRLSYYRNNTWTSDGEIASHDTDETVRRGLNGDARRTEMDESLESLGSARSLTTDLRDLPQQTERTKDVVSRLSMISDDSALDADFRPGDRRPSVPAGPAAGLMFESLSVGSVTAAAQMPTDPLLILEPSAPPSLAKLEAKANDALSELIDAAHPRKRASIQSLPDTEQESLRNHLAALMNAAVNEIRALLLAADAVDPGASGSGVAAAGVPHQPRRPSDFAGPNASISLTAYQGEIRPFVRKVTSTLSKLVLSVRAVWGLLETSAAEEITLLTFASLRDDDDAASVPQRARRDEVVKARTDAENKLRWDVVDGARDVSDGITKLVDEAERLLGGLATAASSSNPRIDRATLASMKRPIAALHLANSAALPGAGRGGNWQGHGMIEDASSSTKTPLASTTLDTLALHATKVLEEAGNMRSLMNAIAIKASQQASPETKYSISSSRPSTPAAAVTAQSAQAKITPTPLQSATRHLSRLSASSSALFSALSNFLAATEHVDLAGRIEYDITPSIASAMRTMLHDDARGKGKERSITEEHIELFQRTMLKAGPLLNGMERAKQALYDSAPALLLACHAIGIVANTENISDSVIGAMKTHAQPVDESPLGLFAAPARQRDSLASIVATVGAIETGIGFVTEAFQALLSLANEQDLLPVELRRCARQVRTHHVGRLRSQTSLKALTSVSQGLRLPATDLSSTFGKTANGGRVDTGPTSAAGLSISADHHSTAWKLARNDSRESYPSSLSSSREAINTASISMSRGNTDQSSNATTDSGYSPLQQQSPSRQKLRRFFGDEAPPATRHQGALDCPSFLQAEYEDEISYNNEGQIKGGTMRALVARLTSHESADHAFMTTFLMTYRTFTSSEELFDLLVARFLIEAPHDLLANDLEQWAQKKKIIIQLRTVNVLKIWIETHLWDDDDASIILRRAADFATRLDGRNAQQILKVVHTRRKLGIRRWPGAQHLNPPPPAILPRNIKRIKFLDIDALEIARQLTLMDSQLFNCILARDCLSKAWPKQLGTETPNITAMTSLGNAITNWVVETVLRQDDLRKRASTIKHFVQVAERCRTLQNFSTLIHIVAGLYTTPVHRLRRTWDAVNQRTMASLQELNTLMSPTRNFAQYREAVRTVGPPCVPFLGVFLTTWTFIGDGNPDYLRESQEQINFNKRQKAAELIQQIQLHQSTPYNLAEVPPIKQYLEAALVTEPDDQVFYSMSLAIEPRERDDDRIARMLSESGFL